VPAAARSRRRFTASEAKANSATIWPTAHSIQASPTGVRFADVAGVDEAVQELDEVAEFLKHPDKFSLLGARMPRGCAAGWTARHRQDTARTRSRGRGGGKSRAPCIVFVDEIDAVGRRRSTGLGGNNDEREHTLNQLPVEMDGFDSNTNVIVIAATNRPDVLDPALSRPGRFDRRVALVAPAASGRRAILEVHAKEKPFDKHVRRLRQARHIQRPRTSPDARVVSIITEHRHDVVRLARELVEKESLDSNDLERIFGGRQESAA
jgi:cell division protease FtsH